MAEQEQMLKLKEDVEKFNSNFRVFEAEVKKVIVGMDNIVAFTLAGIFANGHVLLEGAPGLGKTLLVRTIANVLGLSFHRIQFTADLMPSDITGTQVLNEDEHGKRQFAFQAGPIFANIILADEINRAGPKTQSALLEAMEEKQVSVLGTTRALPQPFFVLATQNPIELEGTYPLPEAQLDRFIFKLVVDSPNSAELKEILARTTGEKKVEAKAVMSSEQLSNTVMKMKSLVRQVIVASQLQDVLVNTIFSLNPQSEQATDIVRNFVRFGPGPRGAQSVLLAAKVFALLDNRINLSFQDIKLALKPALRHRLILNYQAEAEGVDADQIIDSVVN